MHLIGWEQICQWKSLTTCLMKCTPDLHELILCRWLLTLDECSESVRSGRTKCLPVKRNNTNKNVTHISFHFLCLLKEFIPTLLETKLLHFHSSAALLPNNSIISVCHHNLSFEVTMNLFLFKTFKMFCKCVTLPSTLYENLVKLRIWYRTGLVLQYSCLALDVSAQIAWMLHDAPLPRPLPCPLPRPLPRLHLEPLAD